MSKNKYLLVWDDKPGFLKKVAGELGIPNSYVLSEDDAIKSFSKIEETEAVILQAEIAFKGSYRSSLKGFDVIQYLREKRRFKKPIIVCSAIPEDYLRTKDTATSTGKILNSPGHIYYNLQNGFDAKKIIGLTPKTELDDDLLDDIVYTFYDRKGKLSEILHNLKNDIVIEDSTKLLREIKNDIWRLIDKNITAIRQLLNDEFYSRLEQIHEAIKSDLDADLDEQWNFQKTNNRNRPFNYSIGLSIISQYSPQIYGLLPKGLDEQPEKYDIRFRWEALFLDDKPEIRESVRKKFAERMVTCHTASNYTEALEKLKENKNKISIFISDIRLMEADQCRWQEKQGYQVLKDVHQLHTCSLAFVALTSKKGTITKKIQEGSDFLIHWYAKDDVISNNASFNLFFKGVREVAENCFYRNKSQPSSTPWQIGKGRWHLPLTLFYKHHLEDTNYETEVAIINKVALDYIHGVYRPEIIFTSSNNEKTITADGLKKFRECILAGRRIIYGLAMLGHDREAIFNMLKPDTEPSRNNLNLLFPTTNATSLNPEKDLAEGRDTENTLLEEELEFLKKYFKAKINVHEVRLGNNDLEGIINIFWELIGEMHKVKIKEPEELKTFNEKLNKNVKPSIKEIESIFKVLAKFAEENNLFRQFSKTINRLIHEEVHNAKLKSTIHKHFPAIM